MTSSSSLYGTPPNQNVSSTNSTSLYGGAATPIPDSSGNLVVRGDLVVLSGNILTTATTGNIFPANATTVNLGLAATAVNIGAGSGTTTINNNLTVDGDVVADSGDFGNITIGVVDGQTIDTTSGELRLSSDNGSIQLVGTDAVYTDNTGTFNLLNQPTTVNAFRNATTLRLGEDLTGSTIIGNDLEVNGDVVTLAQGTLIQYDESNNRLNRPNFQSTTGNSSGVRAIGPNTSSSSRGIISAFSSSDLNNGKFINIQTNNGGTDPLSIRTGEYAAGVFGPSGDKIAFYDGSTAYAFINPAGTVDADDLATKSYVDSAAALGVQSITGTANQVIASSPTGAVTLSLPQDIATTSNVTFADITATDDLTVQGNNVNLAQATTIGYSENNNRANRINIQSTTGNTSGLRVQAPNATASAIANFSVFNTNDLDNGKFLSMQARGGATPLQFRSGEYVSGVLQATGDSITFIDNATTYATINPAGPTTGTDLTTKTYVDAHPGTTYDIDATSVSGGANLNLNGSDSSVDTVKFTGGTNITVTATSATEITIDGTDLNTTYTIDASSTTGGANFNLVGSDATTDTIKFSGSGATTVTQTSANEITISSVDDDTTYTIDASSTTGGANFNLVGSDATTDTIKFSGSGATTVTQTSANEITISSVDDDTTYTIDASSTTGGANFNLVGSDATTDTVKIASGTGVTVAQVSANELSVAIGQAVGTGDSPTFAGVTGGNIAVGTTDDNTIISTNTNGNITVDPNGTGVVIFDSITRLRGESQATTNNSYAFPTSQLTTVTDNNGYSAASSFGTTGSGYQANAQYIHYTGDTAAGSNAVASMNFRQAQGNSVAGQNLPWLGTNSVAASASQSGDVLGTTNYNGYATTGFANDIATQYQGGGVATSHSIQFQSYAAEAFADGTKTLSSSDITAVASSFRAALGAPSVTGTKGQISFNATTPAVGQAIRVTGTLTGTATGIVSGNNYWIIATASTTTATLSATPNGPPIDTTAGTLTGLTLTRCGVTFTIANQTSYPFGRNALVTISGVNNLTNGTYPVSGGVTNLTAISLGVPHTVAPTLSGTQSFSCPTVTNAGAGYRIRGIPLATPLNPQNRFNLVDHTAASATFRADVFNFNGGAYGGTSSSVTGDKLVYSRVTGQWYNTATITPAAANTAYAFAPGTSDTAITNVASVGSTSRIIPGAAGKYNLQFSVQWDNSDSQEHAFYVWLRKNGTDVADSAGKIVALKQANGVNSWNYLLSSANTTDYWELMYSVDNTAITFPYVAASSPVPGIPSIITTLVPVGA